MSDFRLWVFAAVARHLSFTKAAQELFISQPAVTKHLLSSKSSTASAYWPGTAAA